MRSLDSLIPSMLHFPADSANLAKHTRGWKPTNTIKRTGVPLYGGKGRRNDEKKKTNEKQKREEQKSKRKKGLERRRTKESAGEKKGRYSQLLGKALISFFELSFPFMFVMRLLFIYLNS